MKEKLSKKVVRTGNQLHSVAYSKSSKINHNQKLVRRCNSCLEKVIMRTVVINGRESLACTLCLNSAPLVKGKTLTSNPMIFKGEFTKGHIFERALIRFMTFLGGNHVFFPFKIRRKSKLGMLITKLVIKFK